MQKSILTLLGGIIIFFQVDCKAQQSKFKILNRIKVEGEGGWDYLTVDTLHNRLFISHATLVNVVDLVDGKQLQTIPDTRGVHGIALAYDLNKGFISNGKDTSVTIFDLTSLKTLGMIKVTGINPDAILYDSFTKRVFTFNGRSSDATVIDADRLKVLASIKLDGKPEFAVSDGKGKVYVNIENKSELCVIDPLKMEVVKYWSLTPGEEPSGLALDLKNQKLFSVCDNQKLVVSDIATAKVVADVPIGDNVDGAAYDPGTGYIFSSNGDGSLTIISQDEKGKYHVVENLQTQKGARTIAHPKTHHVFLPTAEYGDTPPATKENLRPRPAILAGTFVVLECGVSK